MPDLGIGEAILGIGSLLAEGTAEAGAGIAAGAAGAGEALGGLAGGLEGALGAAGGGLGDLFGGAGGGLTDLFGGAAAAGDPLAGLGGAGLTPAATAGGLAPAAAGPVDLASSLGAGGGLGGDITAFSPTAGGVADQAGGIFGGFGPGEVGFGDVPQIAGSNVSLGTGFTPGEVGGFNPATMGFGGGGGAPGGGFGELATLGGGGANSAGDLASLTEVGGGAAGPGGGAGLPAAGGVNPAAGGGGGGFFDSLGTGAVNSITKNPLGIGLGAAGLGYSMLQSNKLTGNVKNVTDAANAQAGQGAQLQSYLQTGTLPPGMQAAVTNATEAAKARIISGYASRGQNADPAQNSALAQELAGVDMKAAEAAGQMQTQLLTAGINETNMSNQLYEFLVGVDQKQAQMTGQAISNFAAAMAGGPRTIQIGGATA